MYRQQQQQQQQQQQTEAVSPFKLCKHSCGVRGPLIGLLLPALISVNCQTGGVGPLDKASSIMPITLVMVSVPCQFLLQRPALRHRRSH
jgi:hypothetical protein